MQTENSSAQSPEATTARPVSSERNQDTDTQHDPRTKLESEALDPEALERADAPSMKRVIDVPLTVTLRFGQRQLTLRELLDLNTGSLVELDQQVEEPVHLMLGERVIARGEVVIVDGNYGMRVTEVVERYAGQQSGISKGQH